MRHAACSRVKAGVLTQLRDAAIKEACRVAVGARAQHDRPGNVGLRVGQGRSHAHGILAICRGSLIRANHASLVRMPQTAICMGKSGQQVT